MTHPFTPTYIAMAKAAEEIQAMRTKDVADWNSGDAGLWMEDGPAGSEEEVQFLCHQADEPLAWLPRLDQLLGLWAESELPIGLRGWCLIKQCHEPPYIGETDKDLAEWKSYLGQFKDWHEAVLALKMREKHGKTWDGKGWVKA